MTHSGNDVTVMWFKQVPSSVPDDAPGVWATRLLTGHRTVDRSWDDPRKADPEAVVASFGGQDGRV